MNYGNPTHMKYHTRQGLSGEKHNMLNTCAICASHKATRHVVGKSSANLFFVSLQKILLLISCSVTLTAGLKCPTTYVGQSLMEKMLITCIRQILWLCDMFLLMFLGLIPFIFYLSPTSSIENKSISGNPASLRILLTA